MTIADEPGHPLSELRDNGLLWLINKVVFHPRGYALALHVDEDFEVTGWSVLGNGSEPWQYAESVDDEKFPQVEEFLNSLRT